MRGPACTQRVPSRKTRGKWVDSDHFRPIESDIHNGSRCCMSVTKKNELTKYQMMRSANTKDTHRAGYPDCLNSDWSAGPSDAGSCGQPPTCFKRGQAHDMLLLMMSNWDCITSRENAANLSLCSCKSKLTRGLRFGKLRRVYSHFFICVHVVKLKPNQKKKKWLEETKKVNNRRKGKSPPSKW